MPPGKMLSSSCCSTLSVWCGRRLPQLRASGHGRIVNVASTSVRQPINGLILSNSLRAGVAGLAKTLSDELAPDQITVNTVLPGRILTDRLREGSFDAGS